MAKVEKAKLERLTEDAVRLAGTAMSLLVVMRCPVRQEYERVESFIKEVEGVRADLGLPELTQNDMIYGKEPKRKMIGFELPESVVA
jgi:hypothetical protein